MTTYVLEYIVPGLGCTFVTALDMMGNLCYEMKESEVMCRRVFERLQFIWNELQKIQDVYMLRDNQVLPKFGTALSNFMAFLKKHSRKNPLSRLASSRKLAEEVQEFHTEIDFLFKLLNLVHIAEMSAWRQQWEKDQLIQRELMQQLMNNTHLIILEMSSGALVESLTELKYEIEMKNDTNAPEQVALMRSTFMSVVSTSKVKVPRIPKWFIPHDDVHCPDEYFDVGSYGSVHRGTWCRSKVVIKRLLMESESAQKTFVRETELWANFEHPHVLKLFGGCHVSTPVFFVCEDATGGNFVHYFADADNKRRIWQLFYQAALGLEYLHKNKIVHGDLKCRNLLVGDDGLARICDFGFSFIRSQSDELSTQPQTDAIRWKALECLLNEGNEANPHFESDVYALGMCIIEAVSGEPPWGLDDDDTILENLLEGTFHARPDGLTDKQWNLITQMCKVDMAERMELSKALYILKELADEEEHEEARLNSMRHDRICPECQYSVPCDNVFCGRCGERLGKAKQPQATASPSKPTDPTSLSKPTEPDAAGVKCTKCENLNSLNAELCSSCSVWLHHDTYLGCVKQVDMWRADEPTQRLEWDASVPDFSCCGACYCVNPLDNTLCCECSGKMSMYMSREESAFQFVVTDVLALEAAIDMFKRKAKLLAGNQPRRCPACGFANPQGRRECSDCGFAEPLTRTALLSEIDRLDVVLEHSKTVADARKRQQELEDQLPEYPCSRCGEMNAEDEAYCRECGLDIEVIDDLDWIPE